MTATLLKIDSNTGVFLWILQNFQEQLPCVLFESVNTLETVNLRSRMNYL